MENLKKASDLLDAIAFINQTNSANMAYSAKKHNANYFVQVMFNDVEPEVLNEAATALRARISPPCAIHDKYCFSVSFEWGEVAVFSTKCEPIDLGNI